MINWNKETKKRIQAVLGTAKTSFYYGFIPLIIYLGIANYSAFILTMIVEYSCLTTCMMYTYTKLLVFILLGILTNTIKLLTNSVSFCVCLIGLKRGADPGMPEPTILRYAFILISHILSRVESVYVTPKIFGVEFENIRRTGVRLDVSESLAYWREKCRRKL